MVKKWNKLKLLFRMTSKNAIKVVDRIFRDVCNNNEIMRGKIIIVSGDFRKTLPIMLDTEIEHKS